MKLTVVILILIVIFGLLSYHPRENFANTPPTPTEPGCYVFTHGNCPNRNFNTQGKWHHDIWGEENENSAVSKENCDKRKKQYNDWCGSTDFISHFNPKIKPAPVPAPQGSNQPSSSTPAPAPAEKLDPQEIINLFEKQLEDLSEIESLLKSENSETQTPSGTPTPSETPNPSPTPA